MRRFVLFMLILFPGKWLFAMETFCSMAIVDHTVATRTILHARHVPSGIIGFAPNSRIVFVAHTPHQMDPEPVEETPVRVIGYDVASLKGRFAFSSAREIVASAVSTAGMKIALVEPGRAHLWDPMIATHNQIPVDFPVEEVAFAPGGMTVQIHGEAGEILAVSALTGEILQPNTGPSADRRLPFEEPMSELVADIAKFYPVATINVALQSRGGGYAAVGFSDGALSLVRLYGKMRRLDLVWNGLPIQKVVFSPDEQHLVFHSGFVVAGSEQQVHLVSLEELFEAFP